MYLLERVAGLFHFLQAGLEHIYIALIFEPLFAFLFQVSLDLLTQTIFL